MITVGFMDAHSLFVLVLVIVLVIEWSPEAKIRHLIPEARSITSTITSTSTSTNYPKPQTPIPKPRILV